MANENCLEGFGCPCCGQKDEFLITATAQFVVRDDGTDDYHDVEWDDDSYCECPSCHHHGTVKDFRKGDDEGERLEGDDVGIES